MVILLPNRRAAGAEHGQRQENKPRLPEDRRSPSAQPDHQQHRAQPDRLRYRGDLGVVWEASTKTFIVPEDLLSGRRRRTPVIEAPAAVIFAPVTPAGKIKALLEAAQQGYAEAEVRRTALLAEVAAADAAVNDHLRRIDELTMTASLPENVWKVISEISR